VFISSLEGSWKRDGSQHQDQAHDRANTALDSEQLGLSVPKHHKRCDAECCAKARQQSPPCRSKCHKAGEIVVVTIPLKNYRQVPVEPRAGKIGIETDNYYPQRDGYILELDNESTTTNVSSKVSLRRLHAFVRPRFHAGVGEETRRAPAALVTIGLVLARPWTRRRETAKTATHSIVA
jgi:hypothetical protein